MPETEPPQQVIDDLKRQYVYLVSRWVQSEMGHDDTDPLKLDIEADNFKKDFFDSTAALEQAIQQSNSQIGNDDG